MQNRDLEQKLRSAVHKTAPDALDSILAACDAQRDTVIAMPPRRRRNMPARILAVAAMLLPLGMSILDFFDFITNSVMMPIAAIFICVLVIKAVGLDKISEEVRISSPFKRERAYRFFVRYLVPVGLLVILVSSVLNAFGIISI